MTAVAAPGTWSSMQGPCTASKAKASRCLGVGGLYAALSSPLDAGRSVSRRASIQHEGLVGRVVHASVLGLIPEQQRQSRELDLFMLPCLKRTVINIDTTCWHIDGTISQSLTRYRPSGSPWVTRRYPLALDVDPHVPAQGLGPSKVRDCRGSRAWATKEETYTKWAASVLV